MNIHHTVNSKDEMSNLANVIAGCVEAGDVILLDGPLGVGKTYLTKMIVRSLGISDQVSSPTYTLMHNYKSDTFEVFHIDAYRLSGSSEFADLAIDEYIDDALTIIEWGSRIKSYFPAALQINLNFAHNNQNKEARIFDFSSIDTKWAKIDLEKRNFA